MLRDGMQIKLYLDMYLFCSTSKKVVETTRYLSSFAEVFVPFQCSINPTGIFTLRAHAQAGNDGMTHDSVPYC